MRVDVSYMLMQHLIILAINTISSTFLSIIIENPNLFINILRRSKKSIGTQSYKAVK